MDIFEMKKADNKQIYTTLVSSSGNSAQRTEVKYNAIAQQGYKENWIIFRCLQEIVRAATQLRFKVTKINAKGEEEEIKGHPIVELLKNPNPLYSRSELIKRAIIYRYLAGDAPFQRIMIGKEIIELYVYRPDRVELKLTGNVKEPYKEIKYNGISIDAENFMLWKEFNPRDEMDGMGRGMCTLEPILRNADLLNELLNWNLALLQNGGNISGVFSTKEMLDPIEFKRTKISLQNENQGVGKNGKFVLLEGGMTYIPTGATPKDMDWNEGKKSTVLDIIIGLGLDPINIGINEQSSYNNKNEADKGLYTKTVIPLMQDLAENLGRFLNLNEGEMLSVDYSHIPCLQEDMQEMADILSKASDMTINEKRAKRGLEPLAGGDIIAPEGSFAIIDGKIYLPMNLIDVENDVENDDEKKDFIY